MAEWLSCISLNLPVIPILLLWKLGWLKNIYCVPLTLRPTSFIPCCFLRLRQQQNDNLIGEAEMGVQEFHLFHHRSNILCQEQNLSITSIPLSILCDGGAASELRFSAGLFIFK